MATGAMSKFLDFIGIEEEEDIVEEPRLLEVHQEPAIHEVFEEEPRSAARRPSAVKNYERNTEPQQPQKAKITSIAPESSVNKMVIYQPVSCDDSLNIIDNLRDGRPVVMNLENMDLESSQRILDFVGGAAYAVNAEIHKVTTCIFLLDPANLDVMGNIADEMKGQSFFKIDGTRKH